MISAPRISTRKLRHRAALQSKSETPDAGGGISVTWATDKTIYCYIRPLSGVQRQEAMQRQSDITHEITTRYDSAITTEKRLLHENIPYNIEAVWSPQEHEQWTIISAKSGVAT